MGDGLVCISWVWQPLRGYWRGVTIYHWPISLESEN